MGKMLNVLNAGDRRTSGKVADAVRLAVGHRNHLAELVDLLSHSQEAVRMRAADALEKASVQHMDLLVSHKPYLLDLTESANQSEVRWHLAQTVVRFTLNSEEIDQLRTVFNHWYHRATSKIVRVAALQGMFELATKDPEMIDGALDMVSDALASSMPSVSARARKLKGPLERLKNAQPL